MIRITSGQNEIYCSGSDLYSEYLCFNSVGNETLLSEHQNKNANYLRILMTLRALRQRGDITEKEYRRAKKYYRTLTGADIILTD